MHDFIYGSVFSQYYYLLYYMFTAGPMPLVGVLCLINGIFSIAVCVVAGWFKFNLSRLIDTGSDRRSIIFFNVYFFLKMIYVLCSVILCFYLLFAFIIRGSIEFIEWPEKKTPFKEGRKEMSSKQMLFTNLFVHSLITTANAFHLLQNLYWLKLQSTSWIDLTPRHNEYEMEEDDDSF